MKSTKKSLRTFLHESTTLAYLQLWQQLDGHCSYIADFFEPKRGTVFMLIERIIQLPQENSIRGSLYCILLEWKPLPVIILYECN